MLLCLLPQLQTISDLDTFGGFFVKPAEVFNEDDFACLCSYSHSVSGGLGRQ